MKRLISTLPQGQQVVMVCDDTSAQRLLAKYPGSTIETVDVPTLGSLAARMKAAEEKLKSK